MHDHRDYRDQPPPPWGRDWTRHGTPSPPMRISDADRQKVTDALCRHFADGRLDEAELNERLAAAASAKTQADLAPLLADLPSFDPPPPPTRRRRSPPVAWIVLGLLAVLLASRNIAGHLFRPDLFHPHVPWFLIAVLVWVLLWRRRRPRRRYGRVPRH